MELMVCMRRHGGRGGSTTQKICYLFHCRIKQHGEADIACHILRDYLQTKNIKYLLIMKLKYLTFGI